MSRAGGSKLTGGRANISSTSNNILGTTRGALGSIGASTVSSSELVVNSEYRIQHRSLYVSKHRPIFKTSEFYSWW